MGGPDAATGAAGSRAALADAMGFSADAAPGDRPELIACLGGLDAACGTTNPTAGAQTAAGGGAGARTAAWTGP